MQRSAHRASASRAVAGRTRTTESRTPHTVGVAAALLCGIASMAGAQEEPAPAPDDSVASVAPIDSGDDAELPETVVVAEPATDRDVFVPEDSNAMGYPVPSRNLPLTITVIPERVIDDQIALRLDDIIRNSPNVQEAPTKGNTQQIHVPFIRGFQANGVYRNGFFFSNGINLNTANMGQVSVVKGPNSILYGLMQPGGVVNYLTKEPLGEHRYEITGIFDEHGHQEFRLDAGGPLHESGRVRYRLNVSAYDNEFFTEEEFANGYLVAPAIAVDLTDDTELMIEASYLREDRLNAGYVGAFSDDGRPAWDPETFIGATGLPGKNQYELFTTATLTHRFTDALRVRVQAGFHDFELDQLESFAQVFGGIDPATGEVNLAIQKVRQEGEDWVGRADLLYDLQTGPLEHAITIGFDVNAHTQERRQAVQGGFFGTVNVYDPQLPEASGFQPANFPQSSADRQWYGLYVQDLVSLFDGEIYILGGVRFDIVDQDSRNFAGNESEIDDEAFTGRTGILWNATDWVAPYLSWSQSFTPTSSTTVDGDLLDPETGTQYELGAKFNLLDEQLSLTAAFFRIDRNDVPIDDPSTDMPGSVNGGKFRSQGVELQLVGTIAPGLQVLAGYGYTETEVVNSNTTQEGERFQGVPEHTANLWLSYDFPKDFGIFDGFGGGMGIYYRDTRITQFSNAFRFDSYYTVDASLWYRRDLTENVRLKTNLTLHNAFDEDYFDGGFGGGGQAGQPRTILGRVSIEFRF